MPNIADFRNRDDYLRALTEHSLEGWNSCARIAIRDTVPVALARKLRQGTAKDMFIWICDFYQSGEAWWNVQFTCQSFFRLCSAWTYSYISTGCARRRLPLYLYFCCISTHPLYISPFSLPSPVTVGEVDIPAAISGSGCGLESPQRGSSRL